jgi:hypothetical protein
MLVNIPYMEHLGMIVLLKLPFLDDFRNYKPPCVRMSPWNGWFLMHLNHQKQEGNPEK